MRTSPLSLVALLLCAACSAPRPAPRPAAPPPRVVVRAALAARAPVVIGHRGTGTSGPEETLPENSLASFRAAMTEGADGFELDVELTADGRIVAMHDDTLDRTTTCSGCVSAMTFDQVRRCRLLAPSGQPTREPPPTLEETFAAAPDALVNVELKAYGAACVTESTDAASLARAALAIVRALGVEERTLFSSFDETAVRTIRNESDLYSALLLGPARSRAWKDSIDRARGLDQDAIHPYFRISRRGVQAASAAGFQVNVWTVNESADMEAAVRAGVTSVITDRPDAFPGRARRPPAEDR